LPDVAAFAANLRRDYAAVEAALTYAWSSGQVEGQVTKTKLVKRQGYGR
jgi:transposase